jgi:hypothetical protein
MIGDSLRGVRRRESEQEFNSSKRIRQPIQLKGNARENLVYQQ